MGNKAAHDWPAMKNSLIAGEPITHIFYEFEGPRAVNPQLLISDGILLWHENIGRNPIHDNGYLWDLAGKIVEDPGQLPAYSWVEWVRYQIVTGAYVPQQWRSNKPFPYKGLLVSAIYFQEARSLCAINQPDRAWHLIALAYYHLGQSTTSSVSMNTARAAKKLHADRTANIRAIILMTLEKIKQIGAAKTVEEAKTQVIAMIRQLDKALPEAKDLLDEFDKSVPSKTKGRNTGSQKNDVIDRIRNLLDVWSVPSGPYPEIAEAFAHFSKRRRSTQSSSLPSSRRTAEGMPELPANEYYMRLISHLGDEFDMSISLNEDGLHGAVMRLHQEE